MSRHQKDGVVGSRFRLGNAGALAIALVGVTVLFVAYFHLRVPSARLLALACVSVLIIVASFLCYRVFGKSDAAFFRAEGVSSCSADSRLSVYRI